MRVSPSLPSSSCPRKLSAHLSGASAISNSLLVSTSDAPIISAVRVTRS